MRTWFDTRGLAAALTAALSAVVLAQEPGNRPSFEVASLKQNTAGFQSPSSVRPQGARLTLINIPVRQLIQMAYGLDSDDVIGGPDQFSPERYDVVAMATQPFSPQNRWQPMLKTLLIERFGLKAHTESRHAVVFNLVRARPDGTLGPGLRASTFDCGAALRAGTPPAGDQNRCGTTTLGNAPMTGRIAVTGLPLNGALIPFISMDTRQRVIDATGLSGPFDIDLSWTPSNLLAAPANVRPEVDRTRPTMFDALQEQLGLKLVRKDGPVEVLVIDSVSKPTPD